ncbi:MAG: mechanosensitive ion channel [Candidatus Lokiarchaeota archaeon]|nr:mechanosensitive ion channel [Candidatus Lokiarchaeota archaeon]
MKKIYYNLILYACLIGVVFAILLFAVDEWDPLIINLINMNIAIFIGRKPLKAFLAYFFRKQMYRTFISIVLNIIFTMFLLWLILAISAAYFVALVSFLVVTISFTFRTIINNIASGAYMLAVEQFTIGDLIETNGIQGIIREITLNHSIIEEFDGTRTIIPNSSIFGSTMVKFTHKRLTSLENIQLEDIKQDKKAYKRYLKRFKKIMNIEKKITKYIKPIELIGTVDSRRLDNALTKVADKYEKVFGSRPDYAIDTMAWGRVKLNLYITTTIPQVLMDNLDAFLRDFAFELYSEEIYEGWDEYKKTNETIELHYEVNHS